MESVPLWDMYTPNMSGVRIKLPAKMFRMYVTEPQSDGYIFVKDRIECPLPYDRLVTDQYMVSPTIFRFDQFLKKVTYTDDPALLNPYLVKTDLQGIGIELGKLATCKRTVWQFQEEWRFIFTLLPPPAGRSSMSSSESVEVWTEKSHKLMLDSIERGSLPFEGFYLDLNQSILNSIEIVTGPKCNKDDKAMLESLLSRYCSDATMKDSILAGEIR